MDPHGVSYGQDRVSDVPGGGIEKLTNDRVNSAGNGGGPISRRPPNKFASLPCGKVYGEI